MHRSCHPVQSVCRRCLFRRTALWASVSDRSQNPACRFSAEGLHYMVASAPCVHGQLSVLAPDSASDASAAQCCMICDRAWLSQDVLATALALSSPWSLWATAAVADLNVAKQATWQGLTGHTTAFGRVRSLPHNSLVLACAVTTAVCMLGTIANLWPVGW